MIKYSFRDDQTLTIKHAASADPQKIGEALEAVAAKGEGHLTPQAVVEVARANRHPLHKFFEWNDEIAAEAYRLDQARTLIRSIHIVDDTKAQAPRAFLSIADKSGVSYRTLSDVMDSVELQAIILKQAERDLLAFEGRYKELRDICEDVRAAREKIAKRRQQDGRPSA